jgi:hypothetical protein
MVEGNVVFLILTYWSFQMSDFSMDTDKSCHLLPLYQNVDIYVII